MARIRRNFRSGTITDNPLLISATTMNSANLADLPAVSGGDTMALTLDPAGENGTPEIVYVTAHTAAATSATITRGQETAVGGYAARQHASGTTWAHIDTVMDIDRGLPVTLGYAEVTANQASITTEVDLTNLAVTVTVPAGRRLRISSQALLTSTVAGDEGRIHIKEGATYLTTSISRLSGTGLYDTLTTSVVVSPSAGAHTYKLAAVRQAGTGTLTLTATSVIPSYILVEDITGDPTPYPAGSVPVGVLGQASLTATQSGITTAVDLTGLSVNVSVAAGRTIRIVASLAVGGTVATDIVRAKIMEGASSLQIRDCPLNVVSGTSGNINLECSVVVSPTAGAHTYKVQLERQTGSGTVQASTNAAWPSFMFVEDITSTPAASEGAPGSTLGYAEWPTDQTGITAATTVDLTGLSVTFTVPAGRRVLVRALAVVSNANAGGAMELRLYEGAQQLHRSYAAPSAANEIVTMHVDSIQTPSAGTHTYKVALNPSGTGRTYAASVSPSFLLVEDITGSVWPEGSEVTAGMVASEAWTTYSPVISQSGSVAATLTYARYQRIGRLVTVLVYLNVTGTGGTGSIVSVTLPVSTANSTSQVVGTAAIYDASANLWYQGLAQIASTTEVHFLSTSSTANSRLGQAASPFGAALASSDTVTFSATYEAAS